MWNTNPYGTPYPPIQGQNAANYATPRQTNKIYVTSAEDALARFSVPNTITVYWLQDESCVFEVYTDYQGKKNIVTRIFEKPKETPKPVVNAPVQGDFVTRGEFEDLRAKLDTILAQAQAQPKVTAQKKKVVETDEQ